MPETDRELPDREEKTLSNEQTYDAALAAMVTRLDTYVVPLINETFGEEFTDHAQVVLRNNKHVIRRTDSALARRDSDAVVELYEVQDKRIHKIYLIECEAW